MMKKLFLLLLVFIVVHFLTCKKSIEILTHRGNTTIQIPYLYSLFEKDTVKVSSQDGRNYFDITYGLFDSPLFFFYDKKSDSIFVLYFFDIEMHIFAIKKDDNILNADMLPMGRSLKRIIPSVHHFNVRSLTEEELDSLGNDISSMSEKEYREISVPKLDLGVYKLYARKDRVLEMLKEGLCMSCENSEISTIYSRMKVWCGCL